MFATSQPTHFIHSKLYSISSTVYSCTVVVGTHYVLLYFTGSLVSIQRKIIHHIDWTFSLKSYGGLVKFPAFKGPIINQFWLVFV